MRYLGASLALGVRHASRLAAMKKSDAAQISALPEVIQHNSFQSFLNDNIASSPDSSSPIQPSFSPESLLQSGLSAVEVDLIAKSAMVASCIHMHSRIASLLGEGFYTIGPGGEELIGAAALALRPKDGMALHYRHVAMQVMRQLQAGLPLSEVIMNRARGHVVSSLDPVNSGVHCSIGGGDYDFVVTSTLASQAPPAVGRALGLGLAHWLGVGHECLFPKDAVNFVSVGDGSVNNAHFLAAVNMAEYWQHRSFRVPIVFGISNNDLCISLRGHGWLQQFKKKLQMAVFEASTNNPAEQFVATRDAVKLARDKGRPACVIYNGITRRFGHAATDRQAKYMTPDEIASRAKSNPLVSFSNQAVAAGLASYKGLSDTLKEIEEMTRDAFEIAVDEPKITSRSFVIARNSAPLKEYTPPPVALAAPSKGKEEKMVMRQAMTRVYDELLSRYPHAVYVGEDVEHGGYYLVTETLKEKHGNRVRDWPPDETTLVGAGMGFSESGLLPIVEIPYAKYLDCGADMFFEAAIRHWLSNVPPKRGFFIRLQGFDRGIFGGNFHTHNTLHVPKGIDVVAYSNGADYVRGIRYAVAMAEQGRIVMSVDSTNLLNLRHVSGADNRWLRPYPSDPDDVISFDFINKYGNGPIGIVTYGNGVVTALQAVDQLIKNPELGLTAEDVCVIECPLLSDVPESLLKAIAGLDGVVFADVCKTGELPLAAHLAKAKSSRVLPNKWEIIGAAPTYNPLGNTITFLSVADIHDALKSVISQK